MEYEWDEAKRRANLAKHGVDFADADRFEWDSAQTDLDDGRDHGEYCFRSAGMIERFLHIMVWTDGRNAECRIISLRRRPRRRSDAMSATLKTNDPRSRLLASLEAITDEEEAAINAGIARDPDNPELTDEDFARMRPHAEFMREHRRRGRPRQEVVKSSVTMRLDTDVLEAWRATGPGWQSRMNEALRRAIGL